MCYLCQWVSVQSHCCFNPGTNAAGLSDRFSVSTCPQTDVHTNTIPAHVWAANWRTGNVENVWTALSVSVSDAALNRTNPQVHTGSNYQAACERLNLQGTEDRKIYAKLTVANQISSKVSLNNRDSNYKSTVTISQYLFVLKNTGKAASCHKDDTDLSVNLRRLKIILHRFFLSFDFS